MTSLSLLRFAGALGSGLLFCAPMAAAEDGVPDPSYFTGVYERVGRDAEDPPGLINDHLRITPANDGWGLVVSGCDGGPQEGWPIELRRSGMDEVPNIVEGRDGPFAFWCQYFNDHSNYPVLTCASEMGARFTLWAVTDRLEERCKG